jgi:hypothetical protein
MPAFKAVDGHSREGRVAQLNNLGVATAGWVSIRGRATGKTAFLSGADIAR